MKKTTFIVLNFLLLTITFYGQTNVLSGANAGTFLTTAGINNVFTGVRAGNASTTAKNNVFTGFEAGRDNSSGKNNVFAGYQAGAQSVLGENVFIGTEAGRKNRSSDNVYSGFQVAYSDEWGTGNVFTGYKSGYSNFNGNYNVYIGFASGYSIGTGDNNVFIGNYSANNVKAGSSNTFVGNNAGSRNTVTNTAIVNNTYLGANAGFNASGSNCVFLGNGAGTNETQSNRLYIANSSTTTPLIYGKFDPSGNNQLGINTTTIPAGLALAVNGNVAVDGLNAGDIKATSFKKTDGKPDEFLMADGSITTVAGMGINTNAIQNQNTTAQSANMWINGNGIFGGNVGIGTTDPKNKLSVNGTIWAKEVKVSLTDAADWVFDTNYKLKPLAEVEKYIIENKHLPEVPSAEEFRQNDMNVSEMSNKLLQKIEELTLYAIKQNKVIEELKAQVDTLMNNMK
jgi:hypothetical protein